MSRARRGTILVEDAGVLAHQAFAGGQFVLRLAAPGCAERARPGMFVHLRCDETLPMRRPLSIMRADPDAGWIELLYKTVGAGLTALSRVQTGQRLNLLGPIGQGFAPDPERDTAVLIGGGVGIPPLLFLAEHLRRDAPEMRPVAFFGSELPFPFETPASELPLEGCDPAATLSLALLETIRVPGRLASGAGLAGCFPGFVTDLAAGWLGSLAPEVLARCAIFACGPTPMLRAAQRVAARFGLPSQLCLEEYMACAVGGCAGCAVQVSTPAGPAMRRVCVDGPVFDGYAVYGD